MQMLYRQTESQSAPNRASELGVSITSPPPHPLAPHRPFLQALFLTKCKFSNFDVLYLNSLSKESVLGETS